MCRIHEADINRLFDRRALTDDRMDGAYIASSPIPAAQQGPMRTLRRVIGIPIELPTFSRMVLIDAPLLVCTDPELALYGRYVLPKRLQQRGFQLEFPVLENALRDLISTSSTQFPAMLGQSGISD
ncbi:DUF1731 domain-containing protein [Schlesneria paludicola]|uniref:DUF1731 domain-containing protein n=1 Tax=Schlesneria paludicola TaxID=360056 RepID=UPI000299D3B9|nr:DUF1731 domain-containing protein [Schlesneria paludicola]